MLGAKNESAGYNVSTGQCLTRVILSLTFSGLVRVLWCLQCTLILTTSTAVSAVVELPKSSLHVVQQRVRHGDVDQLLDQSRERLQCVLSCKSAVNNGQITSHADLLWRKLFKIVLRTVTSSSHSAAPRLPSVKTVTLLCFGAPMPNKDLNCETKAWTIGKVFSSFSTTSECSGVEAATL